MAKVKWVLGIIFIGALLINSAPFLSCLSPTVSYMPGAPDATPPEISITAPDATLGVPITIVVSATDPSGVATVMFTVSSPSLEYEDIIENVMSFGNEASLTFTPGWAGTYTVEAMAVDNSPAQNMTPEATPETATFVVSE
jgi:hypothetical protein